MAFVTAGDVPETARVACDSDMPQDPTVTVVIPTFNRPGYLAKAVASVAAQEPIPSELLIVSRTTDEPTNALIESLKKALNPKLNVRNVRVREPGILPPIKAAIRASSSDITVFLDDDAEAHPGWLSRLLSHYADPRVGGAGGRVVNLEDGVERIYPPASHVGRVSWFGRSVGNQYRDLKRNTVVDVSFLMGGNMSYRTAILKRCEPDARLSNNVAFHWEMDVALGAQSLGYKIKYDPEAKVDHHGGPRETPGLRTQNFDGSYYSAYNYTIIMKKHLSRRRYTAYCLYTFLVGDSGTPGVVRCVYGAIRGEPLPWKHVVYPSIKGRIVAMLERKK